MCKEFEDFLKGHDERMNRAQQVGVGIKAKHDKKRRKILGELDDTVGLNFFSIKHETFFSKVFYFSSKTFRKSPFFKSLGFKALTRIQI